MTHHCEVKKNILGQYTVHYACPVCGERLKSPISDAGNSDNCPHCHAQFVVPGGKERTQIEQVQEVKKQEYQIERNSCDAIDPRRVIILLVGGLVVLVLVSVWVNSPDKRPDVIPPKSSVATPSPLNTGQGRATDYPLQSNQPATPSRVFAQREVEDLTAALDRGYVTIEETSGTGASSGPAMHAYLVNQRETEIILDISLKQPMFFRNRGRGQNMIAIKVYLRGGRYQSDGSRSFISLEPKLRTPVQFIAYCFDFDRDNPSNAERLVPDASSVNPLLASLLPLFGSIRNYESSHPNQDITVAAQVAVWLDQGISIKDVRTKFEVSQAQETLAREFLK